MTIVLVGCSKGPPDGPPPTFVKASPERVAELKQTKPAATAPDVGETQVDSYPRGAADFTTAEQFEKYIVDCEAYEPAGDPIATQDVVYQGSKPAPPLPPMANDNIFRVMEATPEFIDPNKVGESAGRFIVSGMFETLVTAAAGNAPPVPGAAESWSHSEDQLTWTFKLRAGMKWSDGKPVTAKDYEYSWKRVLSPELASKTAEQLWFLKGGKAYNTGSGKADDVVVKALDDLTLEIHLEGPTPFFLDLLTYISYAPVPRWAIEQWGDKWTDVEHIVTNGPFHLTKWIERDRIELTKEKTYWDADAVKLAGVVVYHTDSEGKNLTLYSTGQTHIARPLAQEDAKRFIREGRGDLRISSDGCIYFYVLRVDRPPFDDARVRRAFNLGLDKQVLVDSIMGMYQKVGTTVVPELVGAFTGYVPPRGPEYDPDAARELLSEAGYPRGAGLELEVSYNTSEGHKKIADYAAKNWNENLGVKVTPANMEWKSLLKKQLSGDFQISRAGWCPDYPDPFTFLGTFHSAADNNYPAYKNPAYDQMLERIKSERDHRRRNVLMCAAEKGLQRDMPVVPMYQYTRSILMRPEVKGYLPQYQDHHGLKFVSLEPGAP